MPPGPPKQFDQAAALEVAMNLFWAKGYKGTSVQDLVGALGVNAQSLYNAFGDKRTLFLKAVDHYNDMRLLDVEHCLGSPGSPLGNLKTYLRAFQMGAVVEPRRGCLLNNTAIELGPHDPEIGARVRAFFARLDELFRKTLDRAVEAGELLTTTNTRAVASFINSLVQGMAVFSKAGVEAPVFADIVDVLAERLE